MTPQQTLYSQHVVNGILSPASTKDISRHDHATFAEQWATCFDWVITFHVDRMDVRLFIFYYHANIVEPRENTDERKSLNISDQYIFHGPFRSDRRRRVGEYSLYSTTWELIPIVERWFVPLFSRNNKCVRWKGGLFLLCTQCCTYAQVKEIS